MKQYFHLILFLFIFLPFQGCDENRGSVEKNEENTQSFPDKIDPIFKPSSELRTILAFGDSLTAGLGVENNQTYPSLLQEKLQKEGYPYRVINAGVSGETTWGGLRRVEWVLKNKPEIIILELGINDGFRGLSTEMIRQNLSEIIEILHQEKVKVVLAGMELPLNYGREYTESFKKIYPDLSKKYDLLLVRFFLEGVAMKKELNQSDGIHPTGEGYRVVVENIWPILIPLLNKG